jgi:hypothetical protein
LAALQEEGLLSLLEVDEVANATGYDERMVMKEFHEEPMLVSSLKTSFFTIKEDNCDYMNENYVGCNISSIDKDYKGHYLDASNHDDNFAKEDGLKGLLFIASFDNGIGKKSMAILYQEEESLLHLLKDDGALLRRISQNCNKGGYQLLVSLFLRIKQYVGIL